MPNTRPTPKWVITESYTDEVYGLIKTGKESEVSLVRRERLDGQRWCLMAAKRYRRREHRAFRREQYLEGTKFRSTRNRRAVEQGTELGKAILEGVWLSNEFRMQHRLWQDGASVPYPVGLSEHGMLMQYVGSWGHAAPRLIDVKLPAADASTLFEKCVENLRIFMDSCVVHGDLSAYNILLWDGRPWFIDFPQSVELGRNPHWERLLLRDLTNLCNYFRGCGVSCDPDELLHELEDGAFWAHR